MTEPHPQQERKCHGYDCNLFEECADRYSDDEFPPCCASHSNPEVTVGMVCAYEEGERAGRDTVLDEVYNKLKTSCWHQTTWEIIEDVFKELRSKGEP